MPADVDVNESPLTTEHPAVPELLTEYETAPDPLPPVVTSVKLVRNGVEVEVKVRVT